MAGDKTDSKDSGTFLEALSRKRYLMPLKLVEKNLATSELSLGRNLTMKDFFFFFL